MLQVRIHRCTESVFAAFYEVASATAMRVHINAAGNDIASLGIDDFGSYNVQVDVRDSPDLVAVRNDGAAIKPSFRREDATIDKLFSHNDSV